MQIIVIFTSTNQVFFQVDIGVSLRIKKYPQMYISNFASMLLPQKIVRSEEKTVRPIVF